MRIRYESKLDATDRFLHLLAKWPPAEELWRRSTEWRKRAIFGLYRNYNRLLTLIGVARSDVVARAIELSDYGSSDLLLTTDSYLRLPQLVGLAAELAELPGFRGAVAVIVQDPAAEAMFRDIAGRARLINLQRFWLDQSIDVANHDAARETLAMLRRAARTHSETEMVEAIAMNMHTQLITALRMRAALTAARDEGARIIAAAVDGDVRFYALCYEALARDAPRPIVALSQYALGRRAQFDPVDLRFDIAASLSIARQHLVRFGDDEGSASAPDASADAAPPGASESSDTAGAEAIALVSDALPGSIYWHALQNFAEMARREGRQVRALVSRGTAAARLRPHCTSVDIAVPSLGQTSGRAFQRRYEELLATLERVAALPEGTTSDAVRLCLDYALARLTLPQSIDSLGYRSYRTIEDVRRWLMSRQFSSVVVLPHWSTLAWAALGVSRSLDLPTASAPVVTITGNNASLVEWWGIGLIGCYGTQCKSAFMALGYRPQQLELVGNLTLDRALGSTQDEARRANRDFGALTASGRRLILYATSGVNKNEPDILAAIVTLCNASDANIALAVRPHPTIGRQLYADVLETAPKDRVAIVTKGTVHEAIAAADVVITDYSTVGAEAVLLKRPLLVVNMTGAPFPANNYADLGVAVEARRPGEVPALLRRLLDEGCYWPDAEEKLARFTEAYNWGGDGHASRRFLERLEQRARSKGTRPVAVAEAAPSPKVRRYAVS